MSQTPKEVRSDQVREEWRNSLGEDEIQKNTMLANDIPFEDDEHRKLNSACVCMWNANLDLGKTSV